MLGVFFLISLTPVSNVILMVLARGLSYTVVSLLRKVSVTKFLIHLIYILYVLPL